MADTSVNIDDEEGEDQAAGSAQLQRSVFDWVHDDHSERGKLHQTISAEDVARLHGVPAKHLVKYIRGEIEEAEACCSLPFTLLLVVSYAIMAVAHDDAITIRAVEDSLKEDIINNANFAYTGAMGNKDMNDVNSHADFWSWMRMGLLPLIFQQSNGWHEGWEDSPSANIYGNMSTAIAVKDRGFWLTYNRIIGGLMMSQERTESRECETVPDLLPLYDSECVSGFDYDLYPELGLPNERAQFTIDPTRIEWVFVQTDLDKMMDHMKRLEAEDWLDRQTKKIEIAIPSYNAEFGLHTLSRVNFYFSRGGHIWKRIIPMSQYADWHDRWYYGLYDAIWILCLIYILGVEVIEVQGVVRSKGCTAVFTEYFHLWNIIDWASVVGGLVIITIFLVSIDMRSLMNENLALLGQTPFEATVGGAYQQAAEAYVQVLQDNVNYVRHLRLSVAIYPLIIIIRLFKSFSAQPKLALVTKTLASAFPDLFHFCIVFTSVFVTFVICGIVLFGREVGSFTTWTRACISCFRVMLGDIDWEELSAIGRTEASIWLWLYIIIIVLLMLNMIIAIIMDHYEEVKADSGHAETLVEEAMQMWTRWRGMRNGTYVPLEVVLDSVNDEMRRTKMARLKMVGKIPGMNVLGKLAAKGNAKDNDKDKDKPKDPNAPADAAAAETKTDGPDPGDVCVFLDTMQKSTARSGKTKSQMSDGQGLEILVGAIEDFYEQNKQGAELDEVLQLTQKVNYRVKKLVQLARKAHQDRDTEPVKQLQWFREDVERYLVDVRSERAGNMTRLEALKKEKKELEQRLMALGGGFVKSAEVSVNKRTSIMRTSARMAERPPSE